MKGKNVEERKNAKNQREGSKREKGREREREREVVKRRKQKENCAVKGGRGGDDREMRNEN